MRTEEKPDPKINHKFVIKSRIFKYNIFKFKFEICYFSDIHNERNGIILTSERMGYA